MIGPWLMPQFEPHYFWLPSSDRQVRLLSSPSPQALRPNPRPYATDLYDLKQQVEVGTIILNKFAYKGD